MFATQERFHNLHGKVASISLFHHHVNKVIISCTYGGEILSFVAKIWYPRVVVPICEVVAKARYLLRVASVNFLQKLCHSCTWSKGYQAVGVVVSFFPSWRKYFSVVEKLCFFNQMSHDQMFLLVKEKLYLVHVAEMYTPCYKKKK